MAYYGKHRFDRCLLTVISELTRNEENYPDWPDDPECAARIVLKKAQGLVKAATENGSESMVDDNEIIGRAVETGAMALRFLLNINNTGGYPSQMTELQECFIMDPYEGRY
jgi:hypothetical protein